MKVITKTRLKEPVMLSTLKPGDGFRYANQTEATSKFIVVHENDAAFTKVKFNRRAVFNVTTAHLASVKLDTMVYSEEVEVIFIERN